MREETIDQAAAGDTTTGTSRLGRRGLFALAAGAMVALFASTDEAEAQRVIVVRRRRPARRVVVVRRPLARRRVIVVRRRR